MQQLRKALCSNYLSPVPDDYWDASHLIAHVKQRPGLNPQKEKKSIMLCAEFDHVAFIAVQDELDYAYAVKADKDKKRAARAKTKGIRALNAFIAQSFIK
jgi:hypothetical protein